MKTFSNRIPSRFTLHTLLVTLAGALAVGCYDSQGKLDPPAPEGTGGTEAEPESPSAGAGGADASGSSGAPMGGSEGQEAPRGGAPTLEGGKGGAEPEPEVAGQAGRDSASGGADAVGGSSGSGGSSTAEAGSTANGGMGGAPGGGSAGTAGSGGEPAQLESICMDEAGVAVPYDHTYGVATEYAFELSMSCDVGGYIMPLVLEDPELLTAVDAFVMDATDWYRAEILRCPGESSTLGADAYGLLPSAQSEDLTSGDFEASLALFSAVLDRHDGQPDAVSKSKKDKIKQRIKSVKARAVHGHTDALTKTLSEPDCVPAAPPEGG